MGAPLPAPHRCFTMRNPFARALVLALGLFVLGLCLLRSDPMDVRTIVVKTATTAKDAISQQPIGNSVNSHHSILGIAAPTPTEKEQNGPTTTHNPLQSFSNQTHKMKCDYDMDRLKRWQEEYRLQDEFEFTKRYIQPVRQNIRRSSMTRIHQKLLLNELKVVDVKKQYQPEKCPEPLVVPVTQSPFPSMANASDFMFGVSTTYQRFTDPKTSPIDEWTYWLTDGKGNSNGGKLILMLLGATMVQLEAAYDKLAAYGIDVDVYQSDPTTVMAVRYLTLVPTMYHHPARINKKWLVTCDDDTYFPSFHALAERFEQYDYERPMYIGTLSEDVNNIERHGSQAFGGAGVFLSVPMAETIANKFDTCATDQKIKEADSGWGPQGDIMLRKCIYENSEVKLTTLNDLWQLDLYGDPSGFYESGIKPLSLHHYRGGGWHIAHPWQYTKVAHICGEDCTLQRFHTDDDFIISNSFSVAYYPKGTNLDFHQFERTFGAAPDDKGWNLDYKMGPQRPSLHRTGRKMSWDLQTAIWNADGSLSQVYVRKHDDWRWKMPDGSPMSDRDGVMELIWLPAIEGSK
ncbi:glycosyltransferase [Naviculisporaceae sp. PSN 640]